MENPYWANNDAITDLVLAELAEGKGKFLNKIADGIWFYCEMTSWAESAHIAQGQIENTSLPYYNTNIIDLTASDMASFFAWTYYFLKDDLSKIQPMIPKRLRENIQFRIMNPYMTRSDFWWQAFNSTPNTVVNNWNTWCNFNALSCFLLLENDPHKLAEAVHRTMISIDKFINYMKEDGACEEGTSYWSHAAGKLYEYLQLLNLATAGKISLFDQPMIRNMGEYIVKSYIGNNWVVNFADASAKVDVKVGLIFNYGKAVGSEQMQEFASYLVRNNQSKSFYLEKRDLFRMLENLSCNRKLTVTKPNLVKYAVTWYPQTSICYLRNENGFFCAVKGGHNNESHNHNDVGTFTLYLNQIPVFIDAGVGTYTRQTFNSERYSNWMMQSNFHNLPMINAVAQAPGAKFRVGNVKFNAVKSLISLDIAGAYPAEAQVEKWQRTYQLSQKKGLFIQDDYKLKKIVKPNQLNFLTWEKPDVSIPGTVILEKENIKLRMTYNAAQFEPSVQTIDLTDPRLENVWGKQIYRLNLKAKKMKLTDKYTITINKI